MAVEVELTRRKPVEQGNEDRTEYEWHIKVAGRTPREVMTNLGEMDKLLRDRFCPLDIPVE